MNCNCNRQTTAIKWIRGNFFPYVLPITRHDTDGTVDSDGNLIWTVTDYQVMPEDEVSVVFKGSMRSYNMDFTIDANGHLVIEDNGEMPNGVYSIEVNITANDIDGMRRRWMIKNAVQLCESLTQEEMHATTLQADVFWFAKGDTGNGIEGVTLTDTVIDTETGQRTRTYTISFTESEDVIITLTDIDFDIFMDKIIDLIGQVQVNVIPYITEGTKIAKVAGTDIYSPSTPTYDEVPTSGSDNPVKSKGIKSAIDAETSRAQGAETSIEQLISNENLRARAAETSLQNNINSESQRAQQAESVNASAISDIQQELVNLDSRIPDSLADLSEDSTHRTVTDAEKTAWNGKQDALTFDNVPTANSNNPVKSGGVYQAIQDIDVSSQISGKADKSEMSVVAGTGVNADKTTITLKNGTSATVLTQHQDVSEFLREGEVFGSGGDSAASFNSYADTVWNKQQTLSESQKQQVRENIGITDLETIRSGAAAGATAIQSVSVGTTTTGAAGSSASVTNTGTATEPILSFTIPQGAQGIQGIQGPQGERGPQGNTGVQVDSVASIIHSIDPTATYAAADVAGADAVQDVLEEVTELGGKFATEQTEIVMGLFEQGSIQNVSAGSPIFYIDSPTNLRTRKFLKIKLAAGDSIYVKSGVTDIDVYCGFYNDDGTYASTGWQKSVVCPKPCKAVVVIRQTGVSQISWSHIAENLIVKSDALSITRSVIENNNVQPLKNVYDIDSLIGAELNRTFTIDLTRNVKNKLLPVVVSFIASYTGVSIPYFTVVVGTYTSIKYLIRNNELIQFRIPPIMDIPNATLTLTIPSNSQVVTFKAISFDTSYFTKDNHDGIRLNSHLGFLKYAPEQTLISFQMAALVGYKACIVNPIKTSDGVWMCYHENKAYLTTTGLHADAIALTGTEFQAKTFNEIREYSVVPSDAYTAIWGLHKVPTLEEFFEVCAKTSMRPIFSEHPQLSVSDWAEVKEMLTKFNLLKSLTVKSFSFPALDAAHSVLGDGIDTYIIISYLTTSEDADALITRIQGDTHMQNVRVGVELAENSALTGTIIGKFVAAGIYVTCTTYNPVDNSRYRELMKLGVSDFTDDSLPCTGLCF